MNSLTSQKHQIARFWKVGDEALTLAITDKDNEQEHLDRAQRCYERAERLELYILGMKDKD